MGKPAEIGLGCVPAEEHRLGADHVADVVLDAPAGERGRTFPRGFVELLTQIDDRRELFAEQPEDRVSINDGGHQGVAFSMVCQSRASRYGLKTWAM